MLLSQAFLHFIIFANSIFLNIASLNVEFDVPKLIRKNELYKIIIRNPSVKLKFPVDNFAFSFELLKKVKPRLELSVADVSSLTYTGDEYRGFSIKDFKIQKNFIELNVEFRREAHGTIFRIRYTSAKTDNEKEAFYNYNTEIGIIMVRKIEMFLPYTINIQVTPGILEFLPTDREEIGHYLIPGRKGQISCQAFDGLPNSMPTFENSHLLTDPIINPVNNDATKLIWIVRQEDHGKQIQCRAGQDINNVTLNVYHYMSAALTIPVMGEQVQQGSVIKCSSKDGYPIPKTEWIFVSGPKDSNKYYELRDNNFLLLMNSTTPLYSNWTFKCQGSNSIPLVAAKYFTVPAPTYPIMHMYNFTIIASTSSDVQSSNAGVIVLVILLLTILIAATVVGIVHKETIIKFINSKRPGTIQMSKNPSKMSESTCKYTTMVKPGSQSNGADKDPNTTYLEIVGTVQPKSNNALGPIDRV